MGGASSWYAMLAITGFLTSVWIAGRVANKVGVSSIVFEVGAGLVLGPSVVGLIPSDLSECFTDQTVDCNVRHELDRIAHKGTEFCDLKAYVDANMYTTEPDWRNGFWGDQASVVLDGHEYCIDPHGCGNSHAHRRLEDTLVPAKSSRTARRLSGGKEGKTDYDTYDECVYESCKLDVALDCATVPDIFTLLGHTGVAMMIFESGMHFDFEQAKTVGPPACLVAVIGTVLPLITGSLLAWGYGFDFFPDGLSAGTSLAPTSVGIALKLLHEAKALQTYFGQAVMTAAFVDDVLSLVLFSVIFSLQGEMKVMTFFPLVMGCLFMVVAVVAAVKVWPFLIKWLLDHVPEREVAYRKTTRHDEVLWMLMFVTLLAYAQITHLCGTHLWGCFIAGMSFATLHHAHHVWVRQVKRITCWMLRIFFSATLAWSIPVSDLFSIEAFWKGTIMGIGPCILTKVLCAPFMGKPKFVIGWAMVGRAEFAYFIAILAKSTNMMEKKLFAILIWALIYATIFAPLIFRYVLVKYVEREEGRALGKLDLGGEGHLVDLVAEEEEEEERRKEAELEALRAQIAKEESSLKDIKSRNELRRTKTLAAQNSEDGPKRHFSEPAPKTEAMKAAGEGSESQADGEENQDLESAVKKVGEDPVKQDTDQHPQDGSTSI